ncbi:MAG: chemotaxis protein CheW [Treponema sp.]|nr:chemotaxis protein CheW [Treponema sp.]
MAEKSEDRAPREAPLVKPEEGSAQETLPQETGVVTEKFLIFSLRGELYTLPSGIIGEVTVLEKVFPMPLVPVYVRGLINRYSIPYALIDISLFLNKEASDTKKAIILKDDFEKIAFLIDDVIDITEVPSSKLVKIEKETDHPTKSPSGGFNPSINACFECDGKSVLCLDTEELIGSIKKGFEREVIK